MGLIMLKQFIKGWNKIFGLKGEDEHWGDEPPGDGFVKTFVFFSIMMVYAALVVFFPRVFIPLSFLALLSGILKYIYNRGA